MTAAVKIRDWTRGADPLSPQPPLLIPEAEPLSQGEPPYPPQLVDRLMIGWDRRRVGCRSGQTITCGLATAPRPRLSVRWDGLTKAERDALLAFLRDDVEGTTKAFDLRPDGPDEPGVGIVTVRAIADAVNTWQTKGAWRIEAECEEVF